MPQGWIVIKVIAPLDQFEPIAPSAMGMIGVGFRIRVQLVRVRVQLVRVMVQVVRVRVQLVRVRVQLVRVRVQLVRIRVQLVRIRVMCRLVVWATVRIPGGT